MNQALLTTKLRAPRTRPNLVARPRLREILAQDDRPLTLVSAPAGFGKTTLLAEWLEGCQQNGRAVAWFSLDGSDDDPTRFLAYLVEALRTVEGDIGEGMVASLRSPESPPVQAVVAALVNDLADLSQEVSIVLDDYHLVASDTVHEAVAFLIEHLPENVRLVVSTRTDPPLPLPKLRARDQVTEIGAADLRFTTEEAAAFLIDVMGLALSTSEVAALEGITEGWAAALQLAALSMRDREDASAVIQAFSGSNRHILDFLSDEVLGRQPEDLKEFLLGTSVLERMSAPLCDALTGRGDGQEMLERLERENLFVVALDDERRWYRYHHLFRDFLRGRLERERPGLAGELHARASRWCEENGLLPEAIEHALSASGSDPDHELAARLIDGGIWRAFRRGEFPTVLRWLEALPVGAKRRRPRLLPAQAVALTFTGRPDDVEPFLQEAERAASGAAASGKDCRFLLGFASAIRSWRARLQGDAPDAVELARQALSLLPEEDAPQRVFAAVCLGEALRTTGDLAAASEAFAEAAELGRSVGPVYGTLTAMVWRARVRAAQGRLREAEDLYRRAQRFVIEQGVELLPAAGLAHLGMGALLYERNDLDGAEHELEEGTDLAERVREVSNLVWGYVTLSRVKWARGEEENALEKAREARRVARTSGADLEIDISTAWMVRLCLARGDLAEALTLEQERTANAENAADVARVVDRLTPARLLHAQGRHREALELLEELGETAEAAGRTGDLIEILALQALALWAASKKERAVSTLGQALALAEPEGYVRTIVDEGPEMAELLAAVLEVRHRDRLESAGRVSVTYLARLLAAAAQDAAAPIADEGLPEPPSERELEVLALIVDNRSNAEIAARLFVSVSTVKTHINNLYRKLGARGRVQAVTRARELGLI